MISPSLLSGVKKAPTSWLRALSIIVAVSNSVSFDVNTIPYFNGEISHEYSATYNPNADKYVTRDEATEEKLISGFNCSPDTAMQEFKYVKQQFGKTDGRTYYHKEGVVN